MLQFSPFPPYICRTMDHTHQPRLRDIFLAMFIVVWVAPARPQPIEDVVARQNVGVVFRLHHKPLLFNIGHVDLTLTIPYSIEPPFLRNMSATVDLIALISNTSLPHIQHLSNISGLLDNMTLSLYQECLGIYNDISTLLANPKMAKMARGTREFIQYIAPIPSGFIGLAKQQSVDMLFQHMLTVDRAINSKAETRLATDRLVRLLSSRQLDIKKVLNHESDRVSHIISYVNGTFTAVAKRLGKVTTDQINELHLENAIFSVFLAITADLISMGHYIDRYSPFLDSLITLNSGKLPHHIVSQRDVSSAYSNMSRFLEQQFNGTAHEGTTLTPLTEQELYGNGLATFMYTRSHLYAHLRVPTFHPRERMHLYSIEIMPVPFHTNNVTHLGYTALNEKSNRFAIAPLMGNHATLDLDVIAHCLDSRHYIMCDFPFATRPASFHTCMSAIFEGTQIHKIHQLCSFTAFPKQPTPSTAVSLGNNQFAIATAFESYSIKCNTGSSIKRTPCGFCIVSLPPACTLILKDLIIPSTPMGNNRSLIVQTHAVNLPLAMAFSLPVSGLDAAFTHTAPIALDLPILSPNELDDLPFSEQDMQQGVDLVAMASAVQQYDRMSAAHKASEKLIRTLSNPITNSVLLFLNICIVIAMVITCRKLWRMTAAITAMQQTFSLMHPAEAAPSPDLSNIMLLSRKSPADSSDIAIWETVTYETHLLAAILALLVLWVLSKFISFLFTHLWLNQTKQNAKTANPSLKLKIYTDSTNFIFPILSFKAEASSVSFTQVPHLVKIAYTGGPVATLQWSDKLEATVNGREVSLNMSSSIPVPRLLRNGLKRSLGRVSTEADGLVSSLILKTADQAGTYIPPCSIISFRDEGSPEHPTTIHGTDRPTASAPAHSLEDCSGLLKPKETTHAAVVFHGQQPDSSSHTPPTYRMLRAIIHTIQSSECQAEQA